MNAKITSTSNIEKITEPKWRVLEWTDKHALRFGVLIQEYRITRDDTGEFLKSHDGKEWFTDNLTIANEVCKEANEHNQPNTKRTTEVTMKTETYVLIVEVNVDKLGETGDPRATIEAVVRDGTFFYAELPSDLPSKVTARSEKSSNLDEADVVSEIVEEWFAGDN